MTVKCSFIKSFESILASNLWQRILVISRNLDIVLLQNYSKDSLSPDRRMPRIPKELGWSSALMLPHRAAAWKSCDGGRWRHAFQTSSPNQTWSQYKCLQGNEWEQLTRNRRHMLPLSKLRTAINCKKVICADPLDTGLMRRWLHTEFSERYLLLHIS
jgi:hypothetical protein